MNKDDASRIALLKARELLREQTPLKRDCGRLCGAACCAADSQRGLGMLLFPGEEALYEALPSGFSIHQQAQDGRIAHLLTCEGHCDRAHRPLSCRVFPLMFLVDEEGRGQVGLDPRAWPVCPLMPSGLSGLSADFILNAKQAAQVLAGVPVFKEEIIRQQEGLKAYTGAIPALEGLL